MRKHTKIYLEFFNLDKYEDNALAEETKDVCECCGEKI